VVARHGSMAAGASRRNRDAAGNLPFPQSLSVAPDLVGLDICRPVRQRPYLDLEAVVASRLSLISVGCGGKMGL
jgi:hypothetical protein